VPRARANQPQDGSATGQIGVRDPFQLIRHLARSQSDPRKAVAELVQNALDEQAAHVIIERRREAGETILSILDDGRGVLPALTRPEALRAIVKNIGHSRKVQLSFDERMRQAMLGQYGIGILGFWALGHEFQMISRVNGSDVWALTLWEDSPKFEIAPFAGDLARGDTWTEVQVRRLHPAAIAPTVGSRLASYLSVELRGQLLRHGVELVIHDKLSRAAVDKRIVVRPSELSGERLEGLGPLAVPGFERPIELQLFYAGEADPRTSEVKLACAGSIVLDRLGDHPDFARAPWTDPRLAGLIDFPHLEIPPGSRRGFVPNDAATAFAQALASLGPLILEKLREKDTAAAARLSGDIHRQLARMFSKATDFVPHLEWFPVARSSGRLSDPVPAGVSVTASTSAEAEEELPAQPDIFPPGPLAEVRIYPQRAKLAFEQERALHARVFDAEGRRIREGIEFAWTASGPIAIVATDGGVAQIRSERQLGTAVAQVTAIEGELRASAAAQIDVLAEVPAKRSDAGIPQPEEVNEPLHSWRSRTVDQRWQVNAGHADYRALANEPRRKLRYLANLLAKEIISRNFPRPEVGIILEEMVGLLAALERSGAWSR
jgi:histidine kinase/DNA gyrase B/HSP90-like ATPase